MRPLRWALAAVLLAAAACPGAAAQADATTFSGTCTVTGTFTYDRPVGFAPTHVGFTDTAAGRCDGTLDGQPAHTPVQLAETLTDDVGSCSPPSDAHGDGVLTFPGGRRLTYVTRHPLVLFGAPFVARGSGGGIAVGVLTAYLRSSPAVLQECLTSSFRTGGFDLLLQTVGALRG